MRAFTVATAAAALQVTPKWLDNALTRFPLNGVVQTRQGVRRRLTPRAIVALHMATELVRVLEMQLGAALALAEKAATTGGFTTVPLFDGTALTIDFDQIEREVARRLALAVEITPIPRRGRPRHK